MPDEAKIKQIVQQEMTRRATNAQYSTSRVPVHIHNGQDSPRLDFGNLTNRQIMISSHVLGTAAQTSSNYGHFFINPLYLTAGQTVLKPAGGMTILTMTEVHGHAGSDAGTVTVGICILNPGDNSFSGATPIHSFNLKSTANTPSFSTLIQGATPAVLYQGQRLALQTSGTLTDVDDVLVTVLLQY